MTRIRKSAGGWFLAILGAAMVLSVLALVGVGWAQTAPQLVNDQAAASWTAPTQNADGTPLTDLAGYVVALSDSTQDLNAGGQSLVTAKVADPAVTAYDLSPLLGGRQSGQYRVWVAAYDVAGNVSTWAGPVEVQLDSLAPAAPVGPKVTVTLTVRVDVGG